VLGYGPDNFGLVFPTFQSERLQQPWDKAHAEVLQIAATQGLVGVAAYAWLVAAFAFACWRARREPETYAVLAGFAGYQAVLQVNFTALSAAFPFWVFCAAAVVCVGLCHEAAPRRELRRPAGALLATLGGAAAVAIAVFGVAYPYVADARLREAVIADYSGHAGQAVRPAEQAHALVPFESVYATEVGNLAFERGDWAAARAAYGAAASLGTYNAAVYRNLALADRNLGDFANGMEAALMAVQLDRFDPANRALLAEFESR
jgi:tetratricopeptide (TPR) repeat protein